MSRPTRIRVSIDALVLRGVPRADAAAVRRAVEQGLHEHLAGLALERPQSLRLASLGRVELGPGLRGERLAAAAGRAAGQAVATALAGSDTPAARLTTGGSPRK